MRRISRGELPSALIHEMYQKLGGTPGFLENVRTVLRTADPDALIDDLEGEIPGALSEAKEGYHRRIIATRLYEAIPADARGVVSRLAISELPLPTDGVARITGADDALVASSLGDGVAFGLVQRFDEPDLPSLYHPPRLLRSWLSSSERLPESEAVQIHRRLAAFWQASFAAKRGLQLRVPVEVQLRACRAHSERAEDAETFRWASAWLAWMLKRRAEWIAARAVLEEIPESERDVHSWQELAGIEISLGEWKAARAHIERAREMVPDETSHKAWTWHQLGTIDLSEGEYAAAREKFDQALLIRQTIGDRSGEAATLHQLGVIDLKEGRYGPARRNSPAPSRSSRRSETAPRKQRRCSTSPQSTSTRLSTDRREKLGLALQITQAIGHHLGQADTWHNLAAIDVLEGKYGPRGRSSPKFLGSGKRSGIVWVRRPPCTTLPRSTSKRGRTGRRRGDSPWPCRRDKRSGTERARRKPSPNSVSWLTRWAADILGLG